MNKIIEEDIKNILAEPLEWSKLEHKTVMVTGANGFIPSYIVETLLAIRNVKVIAVVRNKDKAERKFLHHKENKMLELLVHDVSIPFDEYNTHIDYIIHQT